MRIDSNVRSQRHWGRKRFMELPAVKEAATWGITSQDTRVLGSVVVNWLSQTQSISAIQFRMKSRSYRESLERLERDHIITEHNLTALYEPTLFGIAAATALGVSGASRLATASQTVFAAARALFIDKPTAPEMPLADFRTQSKVQDDLLFARSLDLLSNCGLGITVNGKNESKPSVYAFEQIMQNESIWEYFGMLAGCTRSDVFGSQREPLTKGNAVFHFDETLALVHNGSELVKKAIGQIHGDPAAAITAARSLVEATLKWVLHDSGTDSPASTTPASLIKRCFPHIGLDSGQMKRETGIGQMLSGMETALHGLAKMRDELSDAHGRTPGSPAPTRRQARLAVGLALAISSFVVEAREARKTL